jgi:hypothetical protein
VAATCQRWCIYLISTSEEDGEVRTFKRQGVGFSLKREGVSLSPGDLEDNDRGEIFKGAKEEFILV